MQLLDDAGIAAAHRACFGLAQPTDVISVAYPPPAAPAPGAEGGWRGDVLVNVERALAEGRRRPGGAARELALYLAHGCDHLSGADDHTPAERAAMRRRENAWLRQADALGLVRGLLAPAAPPFQGSDKPPPGLSKVGKPRRAARRPAARP